LCKEGGWCACLQCGAGMPMWGHGRSRCVDGVAPSRCGFGPAHTALPLPQVACGARHTLLRCASGAVYAFGWNRYGQCCCCWDGEGGCGAATATAAGGAASGEAAGCGDAGIWRAWGCAHGEAIYWPLRVRLRPVAGLLPPPHRSRQGEGAEAPAPKAPRLGAGSWEEVAAEEVHAGAWHSVICARQATG
jgi:hypothetical protein